MIAVDTNILVYAHRKDSPWHEAALGCLTGLAEGTSPWAIPWPCLHEFLAIVTHPRIYVPPTPFRTALAALEVWLGAPGCRPIGEGPGYFETFARLAGEGRISGPMVHDSRIAAICMHNGVKALLTLDRDFSRVPSLKTRNPLTSIE